MNSVLAGALASGNVAGAYLVEGSPGAARAEIDAFVGKLFCENGNLCGTCPACKKIKAGFHPDILEISANGKTIKVEDLKDSGVMEWLYRKSYEGGYKAVVIQSADTMVEQAQNKLLKAIEEPPNKTVFLLSAATRKNILPTVLSRCIIIRMHGQGHKAAAEDLRQRLGLSTMSARVLAATASFDPYTAAELMNRNYFETREAVVRAAKRLLSAKNRATSVILDLLMGCAENMDDVFLTLEYFVRDILIYKNTGDDTLIVNIDQIVDIKDFAHRLTNQKLALTLQVLQETDRKRKLCTGILKKLMLENMLFEILEVILA